MVFGMGGGGESTLEVKVKSTGVDEFAGSMDKAGSSVTGLQKTAAAAGAAVAGGIAAGFGASVKSAAGFDESMQESIAVMGDVDDAMREKLEQGARDVAKTTTKSHEQAAESYYFLASAGYEAEQSLAAMPEVAAFAEAGALDMADATDYATDIAQGFGIEAENLTRVTDAMTGTFTRHNQTAQGMGQAMAQVAPIANGLGMEIEETATAIGIMGDAGIKGSKAGRMMRMAFKRLSDPPKKVKDRLDELGVSVQDSEGNMRSMDEIIQQLEDSGADTADMMKIFGARAGPGMQVLLDQGADALRSETAALKEMEGVTADVARTQKQTFNKQLKLLTSQLKDVGITIGNALLPYLNKLLQKITPLVTRFAEWAQNGNEMKIVVGGLVTALASLLPVVNLALTYMGGMAGILSAVAGGFGLLLSPITLAAGALVAFGVAYEQNFAGIADATDRVVSAIQEGLGTVIPKAASLAQLVIGDFASAFGTAETDVEASVAGMVSAVATKLVSGLRAAFSFVGDLLGKALAWWQQHGTAVTQTVAEWWASLKQQFREAAAALRKVVGKVLTKLRELWNKYADDVRSAIDPLITKIHEFGQKFGFLDEKSRPTLKTLAKVGLVIAGLSNPITAAIGLVTLLSTVWKKDMLGIRTATEKALGRVEQVVQAKLELVRQKFVQWGGKVKQAIRSALQGASEFVGKFLDQLKRSWQRSSDNIVQYVRNTWNVLMDIIRGTMQAVVQIVQPLLTRLAAFWQNHGDKVMRIVVKLTELVLRLFTGLMSALIALMKPVLSMIASMWDMFGDEIVTIVELAFDLIVSTVGWALDLLETTIDVALAVIEGDWQTAWDEIAGFLERTLDGIISFAKTWGSRFLDWVGGLVDDVIQWFADLARELVGNSIIPDMFDAIIDAALGFGTEFLSTIEGIVSDVIGAIEQFAKDLLSTIEGGLSDAIGAITSWDPASAFEGPLNSALSLVEGIMDDITSAVDDALSSVKDTAGDIVSTAQDAMSKAGDALSDAKGAARRAGNAASDAASSAGDAARNAGGRIGLAHGGVVTGPTEAVVGEGGDDEAVIPLNSRGASVLESALGDKVGGDGGGDVIIEELNTGASNRAEAREVGEELKDALHSEGL